MKSSLFRCMCYEWQNIYVCGAEEKYSGNAFSINIFPRSACHKFQILLYLQMEIQAPKLFFVIAHIVMCIILVLVGTASANRMMSRLTICETGK